MSSCVGLLGQRQLLVVALEHRDAERRRWSSGSKRVTSTSDRRDHEHGEADAGSAAGAVVRVAGRASAEVEQEAR